MVQRQIFANLQQQIAQARVGFENLKASVLPAFNTSMKSAGVAISPDS